MYSVLFCYFSHKYPTVNDPPPFTGHGFTSALSKSGKAVSASSKVLKQFVKGVSEDALIDMSCQFLVNLVDESINNQDKTNENVIVSALEKIDIKNAIVGGMISYASLDTETKVAFNCAKSYFTAMEQGDGYLYSDLKKGTYDCFIELSFSLAFNKLKKTDKMKNVIVAFSDATKRDILLKRIKGITSNSCFNFVETIVKKSLQEGN